MKRGIAATVAVTGVAVLAAITGGGMALAGGAGAASAPSLTTAHSCAVGTQQVPVTPGWVVRGAGFTPNTTVQINYPAADAMEPQDVPTGTTGGFTVTMPPPSQYAVGPVAVQLTASYPDASTPVARLNVLQATHETVGYVVTGPPSLETPSAAQPVRFTLAGFPGQTVYEHFLFSTANGTYTSYKYVSTRRFGTGSGPCGTLTVTTPPLQGAVVREGDWWATFDTSPKYLSRNRLSGPSRCYTIFVTGTARYRTGDRVPPKLAPVLSMGCVVSTP